MDESEELARMIDAQVERLLEDGNLKALQRLSVYAEAEATGNGLEIFEGGVAETLFSIQRSLASITLAGRSSCPPPEIYGAHVSADLTVPAGGTKGVEMDAGYHQLLEPKRVLMQGGKDIRLMRASIMGVPIMHSPQGFLLQSFGGRRGAPVDWGCFGYSKVLELAFSNDGPHEGSVHIEIHGHAASAIPPYARTPYVPRRVGLWR